MKENHGVGRFIKSIKMSNKKGQAMRGWTIIAIRALVGEASPNPFDYMINHVAARFLQKRLTEKVDMECLLLGGLGKLGQH